MKCKDCIKRNLECTDQKELKRRGPKPRVPVELHEDDMTKIICSLFPEAKEYFTNVMSVDPLKKNYDDEIFSNFFTEEVSADSIMPAGPPKEIYGEVEIFCDLSTEEYCGNEGSVTRVDPSMEICDEFEYFRNGTLSIQEYCVSQGIII
ncbi:hypothetical protein C2G38_2156131 [Gigaspora rosea]|uniref:Uncharacterized protein n=1 Tax=Gigaspora rosea TaxID=44941 RepID=A0A397W4K0_9GLOM|nr:hypothetical protein C2G38_2156131 [Gigaspora rosea]